ncbi:MAG: putative short-chain dehydrogenase/reductase [Chloroflexi bacterium]|nr:putative short-chain dehydrogenase/reductase [Chloroflexota bacterium]
MSRLEGRVIIVTGGGQGIGRAYCQRLAQDGASVVVADIDGAKAESVARELNQLELEALALPTDVADVASTERMAQATIDRFGRIDGLVNNAAMFQRPAVMRAPFEDIPVDEWDRVMAVNVRGVFLCSRAVTPQMKRQGYGKIVNISSGTVYSGTPRFAHYVTSKAGVIGFTRVLAKELGEYNITVNAVAPGLTQSLEDMDEATFQQFEQRSLNRAIKRVQTPQDLVGTISFLCSSDSDFITGQTLVVDGGVALN